MDKYNITESEWEIMKVLWNSEKLLLKEIIEILNNDRTEDLKRALKELGGLVKDHLGGKYKAYILNKVNREADLY